MTDPSEAGTAKAGSAKAGQETAAALEFDAEVAAAMSVPVPGSGRSDPALRYYPDHTLDAIEVFRGLLLSHSSVESLLQGLCERVAAVVPGADMVGVTLLQQDSDEPKTVAYSDVKVIDIDSHQFRADEGPSLEASRTNRIVRVRLDDMGDRWPGFATDAAEIGVKGYLSAPLAVDSGYAGSLNLYSFDGHGFSDIDEVLVAMFVTAAESAVWNARRTAEALEEADGLRRAMITRGTIEQAKGILMAVRAISPDAAFAALTEQSQRENTRLSVLAARIIETVLEGQREAR